MISKELLREVLGFTILDSYIEDTVSFGLQLAYKDIEEEWTYINIYELTHLNLKQWAKLRNVFDVIDWSGEPKEIFTKAEELRRFEYDKI